jgi:hypothetical protein
MTVQPEGCDAALDAAWVAGSRGDEFAFANGFLRELAHAPSHRTKFTELDIRRRRGRALLKRVFELDLEHCPSCGGELKIIAAILEQPVIEKILKHLGLQARAPPRSPARGQALRAA